MKKFTFATLLISLLAVSTIFAQKVAIIGMNHVTPDGFTFVATEAISGGEIIYFTENEYNDPTNAFIDQGEAVVKFTATAGLSKGTVVFVKEIASNVFTVTSSGNTGTAIKTAGSGSFALRTDGEVIYAYGDTDENPSNGVTEVYSVLYTGEAAPYSVSGGIIPGNLNPINDFANAIVIDGFPPISPNRTEYKISGADRTNVSKVMLENPANYINGAANADLSITAFTNLNLSGLNPVLTLSATPASVSENSATAITYTFNLSANATSNITVNFSVGGTATYATDYTSSGATSFNATSGTATISSGSNSTSFTITPIGDTDLEPNETVLISITNGLDYDAGTPSSASNIILNDDTESITPIVAVTGLNHNDVEGFSFVALNDIAGGTTIYFTEQPFDNTTLAFSGGESVLSWTAPSAGILKGDVIVAREIAANSFSLTGNGTSGAASGSVTVLSGSFSLASAGEGFFAYTDSDSDPSNGVDAVHAVLFTGTTSTSGGNIPSIENPALVYTGAVIVDGFTNSAPNRVEYDPTKRGVTVDRANFQNTGNWLFAEANQALSNVPFANIIISSGVANPLATVSLSPTSVTEDSGTSLDYTFSLNEVATSDVTINFTVGGSAEYNTDYSVSGAASFDASAGSVVIANGTSSKVISVAPIADSEVEILESVDIAISSGTGYDGGSPNDATGKISNDDTKDSDPLVAITGLNHTTADGFSFVAAKDIPAATTIYFTENEFDNTTLLFNSGEAVLKWVSPGVDIPAGQVMVVTETADNSFVISRSGGEPEVGIISVISGDFATSTGGETFYAYEDDDDDPTNGVIDIYAVLYTGVGSSGGDIPPEEDPSGIYLSALVVDGFPAGAPDRTEYDPTKRNVQVDAADFENTSNWLNGEGNQILSAIPFDDIAIIDVVPPTALCQNITVYLEESGTVTISGADVDGGSTDDIGVSTLSVNPATFTCADVGTPVNVTLTVKDAAGNADNCTAVVTVLDTTSPTAVCQNINAFLDASGEVTISAADIDGGSSDNCSGLTLSISQTDFICSDIGANNVKLYAVDAFGNKDSCEAVVTVIDNVAPTTVCKNIDVYLDETGNVSIVAADIDGGSSDACGSVTLGASQTAFTCGDIGPNNVTLTVTDDAGNTSACISVVTVIDSLPPVVVAKDFSAELDINGEWEITAAYLLSNAFVSRTDNCTLTSSLNVTGPRIYTCDNVGPQNLIIYSLDASGNQVASNVTLTIVDPDSQPPTAICKNIVVDLDATGNASIDAADLDNGSSDDCGAITFTASKTEFTCDDVGANSVILTVTDAGGLTATCTAIVTVTNSVLPTAVCKNIDVYLDDTGNATITAAQINGGSSGGCGALTLSASKTNFTCDDVGTNSVTLTVTDVGGNTSSCVATVTVIDNVAPIANCRHKTISLDKDGTETVRASAINNGSWDACGIQSLSLKPNSFTAADIGVNNVVLTVTDNNGNVSTCKSTITVVDNSPPIVSCNTADFILASNGQYEFTQADIDLLAAGTSDNVTAVDDLVITVSPMVLNCDDVGVTTIMVYASDESGNIDSCTAQVGVSVVPGVLALDAVADVIADEDTPLTINLTGIGIGEVCAAQSGMLTATSDNPELINSLTVNYITNDASGTLDIELMPNQSGTANITVVVEAGNGDQITESFMLTINPVNDPPFVMQELTDQELSANETLALEISKVLGALFDDVDDSTLVYAIRFDGGDLPDWTTITEDTDVITMDFEPALSDTGCYNIAVDVLDEAGEIATDSFQLCVLPVVVGIDDIGKISFDVTMYPNPTKGRVMVKHDAQFAQEVEVAVMNIAGSEVFRKKYLGGDPIQFNLSDEISGIYLVNVIIDDQRFVKKLVLDRK